MSYYRRRKVSYRSLTGHTISQDPNVLARLDKVLQETTLNKTTQEFLNSLRSFCAAKGGLTPNQLSAFEKIESAFSPSQKKERTEWIENYKANPELKESFEIAIQYYEKGPYFQDVVALFKNEADFIPSSQQYKKVVENKYVQKVLLERKTPPKFAKNDCVSIRKLPSLPREIKSIVANSPNMLAFVLQVDSSPITSSVTGAKKYKILPLGLAKVFEIEERFLKKGKKGKPLSK